MRKVLYSILWISWLLLIFFFSSQSGRASRDLTTTSISVIMESVPKETRNEKNWAEILRKPIRKSAHFLEFLVLGVLTFLLFKEMRIPYQKQLFYSILFCVLYAMSDEIHQLFVLERTARLLDICIDSAGSITGIVIFYLVSKRKKVCYESS